MTDPKKCFSMPKVKSSQSALQVLFKEEADSSAIAASTNRGWNS